MATKSGGILFNRLTATICDLNEILRSGQSKSVQLVESFLNQTDKHNDALHAVIATPPRNLLYALAKKLDEERDADKVRSPLHGIPVLVKDNLATPSLDVDTTAGSFALVDSKPARDATVITKLLDAGAIVIAKTNLSELSNWKGTDLPWGWSAVGGQTQTPYVRGGLKENDGVAGHSNPGGSSSGSAVGVAAGFAPAALGTETDGSLVTPSNRAALYTLKPTINLIRSDGLVPCSPFSDTIGPIAKSPRDIALLLDVLVEPSSTSIPHGGYTSALGGDWSDIGVGTLDPTVWRMPAFIVPPNQEADEQMVKEVQAAYDQIAKVAKSVHYNIPLPTRAEAMKQDNDKYGLYDIFHAEFKDAINNYFKSLKESKVRSLEEMIKYHKSVASKELPPDYPNQDILEKDLTFRLGDDVSKVAEDVRAKSRHRLDKIMKKFDLDVIIGPADSPITGWASAAGYPIATLPLSYLKLNGRPFGLAAIAAEHGETTLLKLQSAWEATFPKRRPPPLLEVGEQI